MTAGVASFARTPQAPHAGSWRERAACRGENPDRFFPIPYGHSDDAKAEFARDVEQTKGICRRCPVRVECWDAHVPDERFGIWAGTDEEQRRLMRRNRARKELAARRAAEQEGAA